MPNFRILWRAIKTTVFLFGLVGLIAWFAAAAPWYWRAGSALVVLAALALTYQIFAGLAYRRVLPARGVRRVPILRRQSAPGKGAGHAIARAAETTNRTAAPRAVADDEDEMTPAQRRRILAELGAL